MIRTDSVLNLLAHWAQMLKPSAVRLEPSRPEVEEQPAPRPEKMVEPDALVPLPGPDRPAITQHDETPAIIAAPAAPSPSVPATDPASSAATKNDAPGSLAKTAPPAAPRRNGVRHAPPKEEPKQQNQNLQTQIAKAIENRAIMGVEVSVVRGTAYLDGHVATERQRRAAERAARSVVGVERVQNRIAITFG